MKETFADRLNQILKIRNIKPSELAEKSGIPKSAISQYLSGLYEAKQKNIDKLSIALDVNEAWLMGHNVPMERKFRFNSNNIINTDGLDENDIEEINRFVEFIKNKKKNEENK